MLLEVVCDFRFIKSISSLNSDEFKDIHSHHVLCAMFCYTTALKDCRNFIVVL